MKYHVGVTNVEIVRVNRMNFLQPFSQTHLKGTLSQNHLDQLLTPTLVRQLNIFTRSRKLCVEF